MNNKSFLHNTFIPIALGIHSQMKEGYEARLEEIRKRWQDSMSLPRKRKKLERKEILLDHSINEYGKDLFSLGHNFTL